MLDISSLPTALEKLQKETQMEEIIYFFNNRALTSFYIYLLEQFKVITF